MHTLAVNQLRDNPLNGKNFLLWERLLKRALEANGLGHTIKMPLGDSPTNGTAEVIAAYEKRQDDYSKAIEIMDESICPSIIPNVAWMSWDAYKLMHHLQEKFGRVAYKNAFRALRRLHECKMREDETITSFERRFLDCLERTRKLGLNVSDKDAIKIILGAVPLKYWTKSWQYNLEEDSNILCHLFTETEMNLDELFTNLKEAEKAIDDQEVLLIESDTISFGSMREISALRDDSWSSGWDEDPMEESSTDSTGSSKKQKIAKGTSGTCSYMRNSIARNGQKTWILIRVLCNI